MEDGREKAPTIPPPPPKTQRRAREVSSRYLTAVTSPVTSSSVSTPNLPPQPPNKLPPKQKHHHALFTASEPEKITAFGDENNWKSETPLTLGFHRGKDSENESTGIIVQNIKIPEVTVNSRVIGSRILLNVKKSRPGTPICNEKNVAVSKTPRSAANKAGRTISRRGSTPVNRPLQESLRGDRQRFSGNSSDCDAKSCTPQENSDTEIGSPRELGFCSSPTIHGQSSRSRISSEFRSSLPAADSLSHRGLSSSLCNRSLNSAFFNCHPQLSCKSVKENSDSARAETVIDLRKGKKNSNRQEESHVLRILHNRYLQWRFLNAKARVAAQSRAISAERSLHSLSAHLLGFRDSVTARRIELSRIKSLVNAYDILEAQMPLLSEWSTLKDEHSGSLSTAVQSLQDATLRLPVSANLKADVREISEALSSAADILQSLVSRFGCLLYKVDGMRNVASDLAEVVCEERARIEECGDLLAEAHAIQVKEYSLRTHLIQQKGT